MFTSEIDTQHVKLDLTKRIIFAEFKKTPPFTLNLQLSFFI